MSSAANTAGSVKRSRRDVVVRKPDEERWQASAAPAKQVVLVDERRNVMRTLPDRTEIMSLTKNEVKKDLREMARDSLFNKLPNLESGEEPPPRGIASLTTSSLPPDLLKGSGDKEKRKRHAKWEAADYPRALNQDLQGLKENVAGLQAKLKQCDDARDAEEEDYRVCSDAIKKHLLLLLRARREASVLNSALTAAGAHTASQAAHAAEGYLSNDKNGAGEAEEEAEAKGTAGKGAASAAQRKLPKRKVNSNNQAQASSAAAHTSALSGSAAASATVSALSSFLAALPASSDGDPMEQVAAALSSQAAHLEALSATHNALLEATTDSDEANSASKLGSRSGSGSVGSGFGSTSVLEAELAALSAPRRRAKVAGLLQRLDGDVFPSNHELAGFLTRGLELSAPQTKNQNPDASLKKVEKEGEGKEGGGVDAPDTEESSAAAAAGLDEKVAARLLKLWEAIPADGTLEDEPIMLLPETAAAFGKFDDQEGDKDGGDSGDSVHTATNGNGNGNGSSNNEGRASSAGAGSCSGYGVGNDADYGSGSGSGGGGGGGGGRVSTGGGDDDDPEGSYGTDYFLAQAEQRLKDDGVSADEEDDDEDDDDEEEEDDEEGEDEEDTKITLLASKSTNKSTTKLLLVPRKASGVLPGALSYGLALFADQPTEALRRSRLQPQLQEKEATEGSSRHWSLVGGGSGVGEATAGVVAKEAASVKLAERESRELRLQLQSSVAEHSKDLEALKRVRRQCSDLSAGLAAMRSGMSRLKAANPRAAHAAALELERQQQQRQLGDGIASPSTSPPPFALSASSSLSSEGATEPPSALPPAAGAAARSFAKAGALVEAMVGRGGSVFEKAGAAAARSTAASGGPTDTTLLRAGVASGAAIAAPGLLAATAAAAATPSSAALVAAGGSGGGLGGGGLGSSLKPKMQRSVSSALDVLNQNQDEDDGDLEDDDEDDDDKNSTTVKGYGISAMSPAASLASSSNPNLAGLLSLSNPSGDRQQQQQQQQHTLASAVRAAAASAVAGGGGVVSSAMNEAAEVLSGVFGILGKGSGGGMAAAPASSSLSSPRRGGCATHEEEGGDYDEEEEEDEEDQQELPLNSGGGGGDYDDGAGYDEEEDQDQDRGAARGGGYGNFDGSSRGGADYDDQDASTTMLMMMGGAPPPPPPASTAAAAAATGRRARGGAAVVLAPVKCTAAAATAVAASARDVARATSKRKCTVAGGGGEESPHVVPSCTGSSRRGEGSSSAASAAAQSSHQPQTVKRGRSSKTSPPPPPPPLAAFDFAGEDDSAALSQESLPDSGPATAAPSKAKRRKKGQ